MKIFRRKNRTSDIKRYVYWIMNKYFSNLKWALPALGVLPSLGAFAADDAATEKKNVLSSLSMTFGPTELLWGKIYENSSYRQVGCTGSHV